MIGPAPQPVDLSGCAILIVEDEYHQAMDLRDEIERAGGRVIGPYPDSETGRSALRSIVADCAVLDINLGAGPRFEMADALRAANVPFLFLTGYDATIIPARFAGIPRIQKPAPHPALLRMIATACRRTVIERPSLPA